MVGLVLEIVVFATVLLSAFLVDDPLVRPTVVLRVVLEMLMSAIALPSVFLLVASTDMLLSDALVSP